MTGTYKPDILRPEQIISKVNSKAANLKLLHFLKKIEMTESEEKKVLKSVMFPSCCESS